MRVAKSHQRAKWAGLAILYVLATVQFIWCYLWQVRPYIFTVAYERGTERMPFQGRLLMMPLMRWAHGQTWISDVSALMHTNMYWFPRPMQPEVLVQAIIDFSCIVIAGVIATLLYQRASRWQLMTPFIYPIVLVLCVATYLLHTIQNFRFIYDLPSLALFSIALWIIYFRKPLWMFIVLFLIATLNRETTLLLLPIYALSKIYDERGSHLVDKRRLLSPQVMGLILPLCLYWIGWQLFVRHIFAHNASEFYSRMPQNLEFLISPRAWPQMLGACCYLIPVVVLFRKHLRDAELRAWLWVLPVWFAFMFVFGILIETRIFGELIPYIACTTALIAEESIVDSIKARLSLSSHVSEATNKNQYSQA
jgi:hypothetical protein